MSFLKAKTVAGEQSLIAVSKIVSVTASGKGTTVELVNGASVDLEMGFQSVVNRVKELGAEIA